MIAHFMQSIDTGKCDYVTLNHIEALLTPSILLLYTILWSEIRLHLAIKTAAEFKRLINLMHPFCCRCWHSSLWIMLLATVFETQSIYIWISWMYSFSWLGFGFLFTLEQIVNCIKCTYISQITLRWYTLRVSQVYIYMYICNIFSHMCRRPGHPPLFSKCISIYIYTFNVHANVSWLRLDTRTLSKTFSVKLWQSQIAIQIHASDESIHIGIVDAEQPNLKPHDQIRIQIQWMHIG